jgi:hypothetical protein
MHQILCAQARIAAQRSSIINKGNISSSKGDYKAAAVTTAAAAVITFLQERDII